MKALVLVYDNFSEYEIALACSLLSDNGEVVTAGVEELIKGESNFQIKPHALLHELSPDDFDILIISGTTDLYEKYWNNDKIFTFINEMNKKGKVLAAICGGPLFLAKAGVLDSKKYTTGIPKKGRDEIKVFSKGQFVSSDIVVDGNIITAQGWAVVDFAVAIGEMLKLFKSEDSKKEFDTYWRRGFN